MTISAVRRFEAALTEACEKHIAGGGTIVSGIFVNDNNKFCPVQALIGPSASMSITASAIKMVPGLKEGQLWCFINSFDGVSTKENRVNNPEYYKLGMKFRKKYILRK